VEGVDVAIDVVFQEDGGLVGVVVGELFDRSTGGRAVASGRAVVAHEHGDALGGAVAELGLGPRAPSRQARQREDRQRDERLRDRSHQRTSFPVATPRKGTSLASDPMVAGQRTFAPVEVPCESTVWHWAKRGDTKV
jgi:hypothetical protein